LCFVGNLGDARSVKALHQPMQLPQPGRVQHRHRALRPTAAEHVRRISADRAWRAIRQLDHQHQHTVPSLKRPRRQQAPEQRMRLGDHPHITRQDRTQLLQSVASTSGTGKTHLLIALGTLAAEAGYRVRYTLASTLVNELVEAADDKQLTKLINRYGRVDLILVDELGYLQLDRRGAELLFQVLTEREERSAIAIASNEPFSSWTKTFTDPRLCAAIVDRLTFAGQIIETGSTSYRLAHARTIKAPPKASTATTTHKR
jgi:IstB-like ATP binding protein